jgi:hypothetical protein
VEVELESVVAGESPDAVASISPRVPRTLIFISVNSMRCAGGGSVGSVKAPFGLPDVGQ